jgi:hypothetical protein
MGIKSNHIYGLSYSKNMKAELVCGCYTIRHYYNLRSVERRYNFQIASKLNNISVTIYTIRNLKSIIAMTTIAAFF